MFFAWWIRVNLLSFLLIAVYVATTGEDDFDCQTTHQKLLGWNSSSDQGNTTKTYNRNKTSSAVYHNMFWGLVLLLVFKHLNNSATCNMNISFTGILDGKQPCDAAKYDYLIGWAASCRTRWGVQGNASIHISFNAFDF